MNKLTTVKVGDLAQVSSERFSYIKDSNQADGKLVVVTKIIDSSEAGSLVECFVDGQFVIFPSYVLRRI